MSQSSRPRILRTEPQDGRDRLIYRLELAQKLPYGLAWDGCGGIVLGHARERTARKRSPESVRRGEQLWDWSWLGSNYEKARRWARMTLSSDSVACRSSISAITRNRRARRRKRRVPNYVDHVTSCSGSLQGLVQFVQTRFGNACCPKLVPMADIHALQLASGRVPILFPCTPCLRHVPRAAYMFYEHVWTSLDHNSSPYVYQSKSSLHQPSI